MANLQSSELEYISNLLENELKGELAKAIDCLDPKEKQVISLYYYENLNLRDSYKKDIVPAETIGCKVAWIKGKGWTADEDAVTHPCIISQLSDVLKQIES